jgi:hypothetical protein
MPPRRAPLDRGGGQVVVGRAGNDNGNPGAMSIIIATKPPMTMLTPMAMAMITPTAIAMLTHTEMSMRTSMVTAMEH